jgi:hypothetical protein
MVGLEVDIRKDRFSLIPALNYVEYGFGNTLFAEKGKDQNNAGNWSMVSSSLKAAYLTLDLLWSTPVHKNIDFEYGIGVGVGALFGNLNNNWVTTAAQTGAPSVTASNGQTYYQCQATGPAGCNTGDHSNATVAKVGGYTESKWSDGGSVPNVFLHLALPQLGLRIKPIKQLETRIGGGFSLTGFWFGISGDFGTTQLWYNRGDGTFEEGCEASAPPARTQSRATSRSRTHARTRTQARSHTHTLTPLLASAPSVQSSTCCGTASTTAWAPRSATWTATGRRTSCS